MNYRYSRYVLRKSCIICVTHSTSTTAACNLTQLCRENQSFQCPIDIGVEINSALPEILCRDAKFLVSTSFPRLCLMPNSQVHQQI
ncbi:MAG: hypothetical protein ACHBN1_05245 [Heteroscytonema crispum UTEX LB 1556]